MQQGGGCLKNEGEQRAGLFTVPVPFLRDPRDGT